MTLKLQRQIGVYALLLSLTVIYRLFSPGLKGEAFGGLLFMAFVGGVGVNHLYDEGFKTWAVTLIASSVFASCLAFLGLLGEGLAVAFIASFLLILPALCGIYWGYPRKN